MYGLGRAPHPHLFRHAQVHQIVRTTCNLPLAQRGGSEPVDMSYLTIGDEEARVLMSQMPDWVHFR